MLCNVMLRSVRAYTKFSHGVCHIRSCRSIRSSRVLTQPKTFCRQAVTVASCRWTLLHEFDRSGSSRRLLSVSTTRLANSESRDRFNYEADWSVREQYMLTCSEMWDDRPEGAEVIVGYIDTAAEVAAAHRENMPTALVLSAGVGDDLTKLQPLLESLVHSGFRIIIPHLMGSSVSHGFTSSDDSSFTQRLTERSVFVLDFIMTLNINRIDVAIGHSLGCLPLLALAAHFSIFQSITCIDPLPGHAPVRLVRPVWLTERVLAWSTYLMFLPLSWLFLHTLYRYWVHKTFNVNKLSLRQIKTIIKILQGINYDAMESFADMIESRRVPILGIYSADTVDSKLTSEFVELFGITRHLTDIYNEHYHQVDCTATTDVTKTGGTQTRYMKGVRLPNCSLTDDRIRDIILNEIQTLYKHRVEKPQ